MDEAPDTEKERTVFIKYYSLYNYATQIMRTGFQDVVLFGTVNESFQNIRVS